LLISDENMKGFSLLIVILLASLNLQAATSRVPGKNRRTHQPSYLRSFLSPFRSLIRSTGETTEPLRRNDQTFGVYDNPAMLGPSYRAQQRNAFIPMSQIRRNNPPMHTGMKTINMNDLPYMDSPPPNFKPSHLPPAFNSNPSTTTFGENSVAGMSSFGSALSNQAHQYHNVQRGAYDSIINAHNSPWPGTSTVFESLKDQANPYDNAQRGPYDSITDAHNSPWPDTSTGYESLIDLYRDYPESKIKSNMNVNSPSFSTSDLGQFPADRLFSSSEHFVNHDKPFDMTNIGSSSGLLTNLMEQNIHDSFRSQTLDAKDPNVEFLKMLSDSTKSSKISRKDNKSKIPTIINHIHITSPEEEGSESNSFLENLERETERKKAVSHVYRPRINVQKIQVDQEPKRKRRNPGNSSVFLNSLQRLYRQISGPNRRSDTEQSRKQEKFNKLIKSMDDEGFEAFISAVKFDSIVDEWMRRRENHPT